MRKAYQENPVLATKPETSQFIIFLLKITQKLSADPQTFLVFVARLIKNVMTCVLVNVALLTFQRKSFALYEKRNV
jgi:hypothetical protein